MSQRMTWNRLISQFVRKRSPGDHWMLPGQEVDNSQHAPQIQWRLPQSRACLHSPWAFEPAAGNSEVVQARGAMLKASARNCSGMWNHADCTIQDSGSCNVSQFLPALCVVGEDLTTCVATLPDEMSWTLVLHCVAWQMLPWHLLANEAECASSPTGSPITSSFVVINSHSAETWQPNPLVRDAARGSVSVLPVLPLPGPGSEHLELHLV